GGRILLDGRGGWLLPGLALLCRDWRVLQGAVTMILALCPALLLESPRWLLATRQLERARKTLQTLAEDNCPQDSLLAELEAPSEGPLRPRYHSVCEICGTRVIWKNGVILGFAAFIGSGIRHCFTRNLVPHLPHFFSSHLVLLGTEAAACLFVCLTAERFGRRAILLLCTVLTGISSLLLLALTQYLLELIVLTLSVVGTAASHAVTMLSIFFASEVLPTVVSGGHRAGIMLLPESQGRGLPQSLGASLRRGGLARGEKSSGCRSWGLEVQGRAEDPRDAPATAPAHLVLLAPALLVVVEDVVAHVVPRALQEPLAQSPAAPAHPRSAQSRQHCGDTGTPRGHGTRVWAWGGTEGTG
uniref:Solute carrier family 22 member 31 n=1 Tax=Serinus canaria TaxID=9135 RepID=A0A8C9UBC0_SERCA